MVYAWLMCSMGCKIGLREKENDTMHEISLLSLICALCAATTWCPSACLSTRYEMQPPLVQGSSGLDSADDTTGDNLGLYVGLVSSHLSSAEL